MILELFQFQNKKFSTKESLFVEELKKNLLFLSKKKISTGYDRLHSHFKLFIF